MRSSTQSGCRRESLLWQPTSLLSQYFKKTQKKSLGHVQGSVFDYYVDETAGGWAPWSRRVPDFDYAAAAARAAPSDGSSPLDLSALFVPTQDSVRLQFLLGLVMKNGHHAMLVGGSGTGKSAVVRDMLRRLSPDTRESPCLRQLCAFLFCCALAAAPVGSRLVRTAP